MKTEVGAWAFCLPFHDRNIASFGTIFFVKISIEILVSEANDIQTLWSICPIPILLVENSSQIGKWTREIFEITLLKEICSILIELNKSEKSYVEQ